MARAADLEIFMQAALREASRGLGQTTPNPMVGAVLVDKNRILARGYHRRAGAPHAEIECLQRFGKPLPRTGTLFVTLEPCSTSGKTPPCTLALAAMGLRKIVIGAVDPNPRHSGRGIEELRCAGLKVTVGVLEEECTRLNRAYNKWIRTGLPFVIAKCGMSLDGRLARPPKEERRLTGASAHRHAHQTRASVDAILVGAKTVRLDDPRLTARGVSARKQPLRVVLTRSGRLPKQSRIRVAPGGETLIYRDGSLRKVLEDLGRREVLAVLIEGGGEILSQALDERIIDTVHIYLAPLCTGGTPLAFAGRGASATTDSVRLGSISYKKLGDDLFVEGQTST